MPSGAWGRALQDGLSGTGGTAPAPDRHRPSPGRGRGDTVRAWTELFRVSALFSVPGDALAGAAAVGRSPGRGTALAIGASLCLYEAGMALNDWADREEDAVDRPHRPIPSGRISPPAALGAAGVLTAAGLALAARGLPARPWRSPRAWPPRSGPTTSTSSTRRRARRRWRRPAPWTCCWERRLRLRRGPGAGRLGEGRLRLYQGRPTTLPRWRTPSVVP
ncbi:protein of unknown function [Streptomyces sp. KY70]|nr:protein of unknown function [Streptomyces sp. KY70]